jgi:hypothetical protein
MNRGATHVVLSRAAPSVDGNVVANYSGHSMGGVELRFAIEALPTAVKPSELLERLWDQIEAEIRRACTGNPIARQVLDSDYLANQDWHTSESELRLAFSDLAGACWRTGQLFEHWTHLALSSLHSDGTLEDIFRSSGYRLRSPTPRSIARELWNPGHVFVTLLSPGGQETFYGLDLIGDKLELSHDLGDELSGDWSLSNHPELAATALVGDCYCPMCDTLRTRIGLSARGGISLEQIDRVHEARKKLEGSPEGQQLARVAAQSLADDDNALSSGTPELTQLAEWLGGELALVSLTGLVLNQY